MSAVIACVYLKHNSWPTPHPSVICVELLEGSRQPMTRRLATHPNNTAVKRAITDDTYADSVVYINDILYKLQRLFHMCK